MSDPRDAGRSIGCLPTVLVASVYAAAAAVFAFPLALPSAMTAGAAGAAIGALLGPLLATSRLRTGPQLLVVAAVIAAAVALRALATGDGGVAGFLGPSVALELGDALLFGAGALGVALGLRAAGTRRAVFVGLEVVVIGAAFAALLLSHRNGAINRPFELADPILAAGLDPTNLFVGAGALTAVVFALLLMRERSVGRSVLHVLSALLVLALLVFTTRTFFMPEPPVRGLEAQQQEQEQPQPRGGGSGRSPPTAVVIFHDEYSPPNGVYYFRQSAQSHYNGTRLVEAARGDVDRDLPRGFPAAPTSVAELPPSQVGRHLLETTVALMGEHPKPFGLEAPIELAPTENPDPSRFRRVYRVTSSARTSDLLSMVDARGGDPSWTDEQRAHYTQAPSDPRYHELAERILEEMLPPERRDSAVAKMVAITEWLGREGSYSTRRRHPGTEDATSSFLFGDKIGYCVHFAHAATYLLRSVGVPTRVANGYMVEEASRQGGSSLVITDDRAHAWPEIYVEGQGWIVSDVYPQNVLDPPPPPPDPELQRVLGEMARGQHQDNPVARQIREELLAGIGRRARSFSVSVLAVVAALVAFGFLVKLWRRLRPLWVRLEAWPRVAYRAELDRLAEVSLRREPGESPEAFAERVAARSLRFRALTDVHVARAFGSKSALARAAALRAAMPESGLSRAFPAWRRLLGALHPYSWLFSR